MTSRSQPNCAGEVEHEAEDGDRRELDDEADQLHRDLEHALDRVLAAVRCAGVCTSSRPMPKNSAKNITARMSLSLIAVMTLLGTMSISASTPVLALGRAATMPAAPSPPCGQQLARRAGIDAVAGPQQVDQREADRDGDARDDHGVDERLQADAAERADVAHLGDADDQRARTAAGSPA